MAEMWLPFPRAELIRRRRCPDCGTYPPKQGHKPECPNREEED